MINQTDIAYAAGVFDSEGTLGIYKIGKYKQLKVQMYNTNQKLLSWFKNKFGGAVSGPFIRKDFPQRKPQWQWSISLSRGAELFLKLIEGYAIEKQEKIKEALEFCEEYKPRISRTKK